MKAWKVVEKEKGLEKFNEIEAKTVEWSSLKIECKHLREASKQVCFLCSEAVDGIKEGWKYEDCNHIIHKKCKEELDKS